MAGGTASAAGYTRALGTNALGWLSFVVAGVGTIAALDAAVVRAE